MPFSQGSGHENDRVPTVTPIAYFFHFVLQTQNRIGMKNVPSLPYSAARASLFPTGLPYGLPVPTCPQEPPLTAVLACVHSSQAKCTLQPV